MVPVHVLLSTAYFPPVSWFASLLLNGKIQIEACETYYRQSYRNRCYIYGPNGKQALVIPVNKPNRNHTRITKIIIPENNNWRKMHWRSIITAYNKSPFFLFYRDPIEKALFRSETNLFGFNLLLINLIAGLLGLEITISETSSFEKSLPGALDLRNMIHPKKVCFENKVFPEYMQVYSSKYGFQSDLSILDLLFNEGPASLDYLRIVTRRIADEFEDKSND